MPYFSRKVLLLFARKPVPLPAVNRNKRNKMTPEPTPSTYRFYTCLSVAGSDCCGGAGIQADLKTFSALGVYGMTAVTALTAQNTCGVQAVFPADEACLRAQLRSVFSDVQPDAVKVGMVYGRGQVEIIADALASARPRWVVYDPVMVSSSGTRLMADDALQAVVERLLPLCSLLTPNLPEAEVLCGHSIATPDERLRAAREIAALGPQAVLLKGGHWPGAAAEDLLWDARKEEASLYSAPRVDTHNAHGTGCTLSSAIAACLARGENVQQAVGEGKRFLTEALRAAAGLRMGKGENGPMNHFFAPQPLIKR